MIAIYDFAYDETVTAIRVAGSIDAPLFCASDVCKVLGLSNSRQALSKLEEDEVASVTINDTSSSSRNTITMMHVTESGLYALVFRSRKPQAKEFRKWVTSEVLPAIRKTGRFEAEKGVAVEEVQNMTTPQWLELLNLDLVRDAATCQLLLERVQRAAQMLRYNPASFRDVDGFQRMPLPVLLLAEGIFVRDMKAPTTPHFLPRQQALASGGEV